MRLEFRNIWKQADMVGLGFNLCVLDTLGPFKFEKRLCLDFFIWSLMFIWDSKPRD